MVVRVRVCGDLRLRGPNHNLAKRFLEGLQASGEADAHLSVNFGLDRGQGDGQGDNRGDKVVEISAPHDDCHYWDGDDTAALAAAASHHDQVRSMGLPSVLLRMRDGSVELVDAVLPSGHPAAEALECVLDNAKDPEYAFNHVPTFRMIHFARSHSLAELDHGALWHNPHNLSRRHWEVLNKVASRYAGGAQIGVKFGRSVTRPQAETLLTELRRLPVPIEWKPELG